MCRAGASWVRDNILAKHPQADLAVYVVWLPMLSTDGRAEIDTGLLDDRRVQHFWDEGRVSGRWFADSGVGSLGDDGGVVWDAFYVFGPDAVWNEEPGPVVGDGGPVISETSRLETALAAHLERD